MKDNPVNSITQLIHFVNQLTCPDIIRIFQDLRDVPNANPTVKEFMIMGTVDDREKAKFLLLYFRGYSTKVKSKSRIGSLNFSNAVTKYLEEYLMKEPDATSKPTYKSLYVGWEIMKIDGNYAKSPHQSPNCLLTAALGGNGYNGGIKYEYNEMGDIVKEITLGLNKKDIYKIVTYTYEYDELKRKVKRTSNTDDVLMKTKQKDETFVTYDTDGRIIKWIQKYNDGNAQYTRTEKYTYTQEGKLLSAFNVERNQIIQENKYNQAGSLIQVKYNNEIAEFDYDEMGEKKR